MLYHDRINISKGIGINKISASKECDNCHYWYFLYKGFTFELYVCKGCHDISVMSIILNDIAILSINGADYRCIINGIILVLLAKVML